MKLKLPIKVPTKVIIVLLGVAVVFAIIFIIAGLITGDTQKTQTGINVVMSLGGCVLIGLVFAFIIMLPITIKYAIESAISKKKREKKLEEARLKEEKGE